jgi:hypothetical protein
MGPPPLHISEADGELNTDGVRRAVKQRLLRYAASALLFSEKGVDPQVHLQALGLELLALALAKLTPLPSSH